MVRVDGKDADALGPQYVKAQAELKPADPNGPFEESQVWDQLRTVFDPEIPVNIVDLGLVYKCESTPLPDGGYRVGVQMTMTAEGLYPEHDLFIQLMKLKNTLRWLVGEEPITHLGHEYYD